VGAMLGMRLERTGERVSQHLDRPRREATNLQVIHAIVDRVCLLPENSTSVVAGAPESRKSTVCGLSPGSVARR
jgi:hypothetical protein